MKIKELLNIIDGFAPLETAYPWDNCGLMTGDSESVITSLYLTLDADAHALQKAKELGCNTVLSHHPLIFDKLSCVTADSLVYRYIKEGISVISLHTPLDMAEGGVNDCLASAIGLCDIKPLCIDGMPIARSGISRVTDGFEFGDNIKKALELDGYECIVNRPVRSVAVACGSGGSMLSDAFLAGHDTLVTGEAKHDALVLCENLGMNIFVLGHFASENPVLAFLNERLSEYVPCHISDRKRLTYRR